MKARYFLVTVLIFLVVLGALFFLNKHSLFKITSQPSVVKEIQNLNRLETAQFTIEKIIDAQTNNANVFQEFLYGDKILLIAHGEVVAGFDLAKLSKNDVSITNGSLTIKLPPPEILYSRIDNNQTKVYDRRQGLLTKGNKDLESEARKTAENEIRKAACDEHILDTASQNADKQITAMFSGYGFSSVRVEIPAGNCQ